MLWRSRRRRRRQWIGNPHSLQAQLALLRPYWHVSWLRHEEPFNKRDRLRRRARLHKYRQRRELLPEQQYTDGWFTQELS